MKHLLAGKVIKRLLDLDSTVTDLVGTKIYPIIADEGTTFPFVIYRRTGLDASSLNNTKDYFSTGEVAIIDVVIASDKYTESIEVADAVGNALLDKRGRLDDLNIEIKLVDSDEDWSENTFIQILTFRIEIN